MALYELTARSDMYLGGMNKIFKGESFTMNFNSMGIRPFSVFNKPESRNQMIRQFAARGIDIPEAKLTGGYWDVKDIGGRFNKSLDLPQSAIENLSPSWTEVGKKIDDVEMKKGCIDVVKDFYDNNLDLHYEEQGMEGRAFISNSFYECVKEQMGIDAELMFSPISPNDAGGYNSGTNTIELNTNYLEKGECDDLLNTILHESRHAFQQKAIANPESVSIKGNLIEVWKDNFKNYIHPQFDFEAYESQPIEADANYFADSVMRKGQNNSLYA